MKFIILSVLLFFSAVLAIDDVLVLDADNFDEEIANHDLLLVEFYAPWCGHCKKLAPEYEKAATQLKLNQIKIAKIDADNEKNRPLASKYGIKGFPTLKVFKNGKYAFDYQGPRDAFGIVNYMKKLARPAVTPLENIEEAEKFIEDNEVVIVSFVEDETFKKVAESLKTSYAFAIVSNEEIRKKLEKEENEKIVLFKQFDERRASLKEIPSLQELSEWIKDKGAPLIGEIGPTNYAQFVEAGLPLLWIFIDPTVEGQKEEILDKYSNLAKETKSKFSWIWIDWSKYSKQSERVGLSGTVVPALAIDEQNTGRHFGKETDLEVENVEKWIQTYLSGELEPTIRSEDIPENNDGPVTVVVAKNFDEIVLNSGKDVLVEFYAPWCGHCKALAPIYEELGEFFQDDKNIVIAKIDATANDINPLYDVRGFPTLKFFQAENPTNPITFEAERSLEPLKNFISSSRKTQPSTSKE